MAPVQKLNTSLVALATAVLDWRLASAAILPRAELATELTPLSHMLMNGFFFNHGFDIALSLTRPCRGLSGRLGRRTFLADTECSRHGAQSMCCHAMFRDALDVQNRSRGPCLVGMRAAAGCCSEASALPPKSKSECVRRGAKR